MKNALLLLTFLLLAILPVSSQNHLLPLWENDIPNFQATDETEQISEENIIRISKVQQPTIEVYLPAKASATGQAVVICPGGGYQILAYDWEGTDIAKWLNSKGIAGIVLKYRLPTSASQIEPHQSPLLDAKRAMRLVRHHAKEWNIDTEKVGIMGFSAGGHLAATLGTHFDAGIKEATDPIDRISSRPDFMTLIYPVISFTKKFHSGSKRALIGENPTPEMVHFYSNEFQVGYDAPPTFLIHTSDDQVVPVENSLAFYQALKDKNVPTELHIYPAGGHGFGLAVGRGNLQTWTDRLADWLAQLNENDPKKEEWKPMFNGKDLTGWDIHIAGHEIDENYKNTFVVEDDMLRIKYDEYENFDDKFGHLYFEQPMEYYKMQFDYRFTGEQTPGGATWNVRNSGVMFHSQSPQSLGKNQFFPVSVELQLLGGLNNGETRTTANICTPGTYFEIDGQPIKDHCYNSSSKTYDGDQWVNVEATVLGDSTLIHIVENDTVLVYEHPRLDQYFIAERSKLSWESAHVDAKYDFIKRADELMRGGYIALQAESHPIDFKNVEILNLKGCMDKNAKNYKEYYVKADNSLCKY
ncbi:MAG: family 16 glycoside hydrolase [Saprospiraceae bacterium]